MNLSSDIPRQETMAYAKMVFHDLSIVVISMKER